MKKPRRWAGVGGGRVCVGGVRQWLQNQLLSATKGKGRRLQNAFRIRVAFDLLFQLVFLKFQTVQDFERFRDNSNF